MASVYTPKRLDAERMVVILSGSSISTQDLCSSVKMTLRLARYEKSLAGFKRHPFNNDGNFVRFPGSEPHDLFSIPSVAFIDRGLPNHIMS